jgi:superfamily II DNA helicase RecQ
MLNEISQDTRTFAEGGREVSYTPKLLQSALAMKLNPPDLSRTWDHVPLLVIDEIHYIAEVGHDFRLDYAQVWGALDQHAWYRKARKLGLTATVNQRVRASMQQALPALKDWHLVLGSLYRENITLRVQPKPVNDAARIDYVYQLYNNDPVSVYSHHRLAAGAWPWSPTNLIHLLVHRACTSWCSARRSRKCGSTAAIWWPAAYPRRW